MRRRLRRLGWPAAAVALVVVAFLGLVGVVRGSDPVVVVEPGQSVALAAAASPGGVVELAPGRHAAFTLDVPVTVRAQRGAVVEGGIEVRADGVRLDGVRVEGGKTGVLVRGVQDVTLDDVVVRGAELHGIEVAEGSAAITGCDVGGLRSPYAQGIEVRNAAGLPRSVVQGCSVDGGQEGIVSHVSQVEVIDNRVERTTMRGITITEMSEGLVEGNMVMGATGTGLYCGDMSHCEIRDNHVEGVSASPGGARSGAGHAVVVQYHAAARIEGNRFSVSPIEPVLLLDGSRTVDHFPLSVWPPGWRGGLPVVPVAAVSLGLILAVRLVTGRLIARRERRRRPPAVGALRRPVVHAVIAAFVVQSFHMVEHVVQVWQVYVGESPERSGLLGARVDTEWVHFTYNSAVFAVLVLVWLATRPHGLLEGGAAAWLLAGLLVQGYHVVEHTAKVIQHEAHGIHVAPGIFGDDVGLVWFHFGINLAVFAAFTVAVVGVAWLLVRTGPARQALRLSPA